MAKEKEDPKKAAVVPEPTNPEALPELAEQPAEERPNRTRYAAMFGEDNPDVDFEDKEARYGRLADERENYRSLKKSGRALSQALDKNRWIGAMFQDLADNPEKNPLVWLVENGIDVKGALDDPEIMSQVDEAFKGWQQKQVDGEAAEAALDASLDKSMEALQSVQSENKLSDEQVEQLWAHFWDDVYQPAFSGEVSKDTWLGLLHAMNYDTDMKNAREESALQARNEKFTNKLKTYDEEKVPPSLSQGGGGRTAPTSKKRESLMDFVRKNS